MWAYGMLSHLRLAGGFKFKAMAGCRVRGEGRDVGLRGARA